MTPNGAPAYLTSINSHTFSVSDTAINTVIATVPMGNRPAGLAISSP